MIFIHAFKPEKKNFTSTVSAKSESFSHSLFSNFQISTLTN